MFERKSAWPMLIVAEMLVVNVVYIGVLQPRMDEGRVPRSKTIPLNVPGTSDDEAALAPAHALPITATGGGSTYMFLDSETAAGDAVYFQILELTSAGEPSRTPVFTVDEAGSRSIKRSRPGSDPGVPESADSPASDRTIRRTRR